jgi:hypothetical protein
MRDSSLIYIAGYGRSGSTLLEIALKNLSKSVIPLGEASLFPERLIKPRLGCSCGSSYLDCQYWSSFSQQILRSHYYKDLIDIQSCDHLLSFAFRCRSAVYDQFWFKFFDFVLSSHDIPIVSPPVFVDSSKTTYFTALRPLRMRSLFNRKIILLVPVRKLSDLLFRSRLRGRNIDIANKSANCSLLERLTGPFWLIILPLTWMHAILQAAVLGFFFGFKTIFIPSRLIFSDPLRISSFLLEHMEVPSSPPSSFQLYNRAAESLLDSGSHLIEGNRVSRASSISVNYNQAATYTLKNILGPLYLLRDDAKRAN